MFDERGCGVGRRVSDDMENTVNDDGNTATHMAFLYGWSDLGYYMVDALGCDDTVENAK